jgi:hypothetical protein
MFASLRHRYRYEAHQVHVKGSSRTVQYAQRVVNMYDVPRIYTPYLQDSVLSPLHHASRRLPFSQNTRLEERSDGEYVCVLDRLGFRERDSTPPQHPGENTWLAGSAVRGDKGDEMGDFRASTLAQDS